MSQLIMFDTSAVMGDVSQLIPDSGTSPVVPTAGGAITVTSTNGITTVGGLNTININLLPEVYTVMTAQTVDDTPTALADPITIDASSAYTVEALVVGAASDYSQIYSLKIFTGVRRGAVGAPVMLSQSVAFEDQDPVGTLESAFALNGNDLELQVIGEIGLTVNWKASVSYVKLP